MAIDVYLIVFHCYDTQSLRKLEWKYMLGISVLTFIPAMVLLFINTEEKGPMYGSVTVRATSQEVDTPLTVADLVCHRPQVGAVQNCDILRANMVCQCSPPPSAPFPLTISGHRLLS